MCSKNVLGLSYRKGLTWARTADPEEPLLLLPVEMRTTLAALNTQEPAENMYISISAMNIVL